MGQVMQLIANAADQAISRARLALFGSGLDAKRVRAWDEYGYPKTLEFDQLLTAYQRTGAGFGAVSRLLSACWAEWPRIKPDDGTDEVTGWEDTVSAALEKHWPALMDFDRRNLVGRYAGLVLRVADSLELDQPMGRASRLVELVPLFESQLRVAAWVDDQRNENFGKPAMYEYRTSVEQTTAPNSNVAAKPATWIRVHPSRVIVLAEGGSGDMIDGMSLLAPGYNKLVDLEKIEGGSAEGVFKNSSRATVVEFDANTSVTQAVMSGTPGQAPGNVADMVEEQVKALNSSHDASMMLKGAKAYPLQVSISDPTGTWTACANEFAASVQIPFTVLFGQQTGRLASDQDAKDMAGRAKSRQRLLLTPMLRDLVARLIGCGILPAQVKFVVEWVDLMAPSDKDKIANAKAMAEVSKQVSDTGQGPAFDVSEIRRAAGFDPMEEPVIPEGTEGDPTPAGPQPAA